MSTISELQARIGEVNIANGWRERVETFPTEQARTHAQITRLALITTEVSEAIEEIRVGRRPDETHYSHSKDSAYNEHERYNRDGSSRKPEGVPSELADVVIRALDAADAWGIDLEAMIAEKLEYNAQRGFRHGGKTA